MIVILVEIISFIQQSPVNNGRTVEWLDIID